MSLEQEEFLKEHGYFVVHDVMPKDVCENLAKEFARDAEYIGVKDDLCPSVNGLYNHMPFVRTLVGLVPHISHLAGEAVLPTYSYARHYNHQGADLKRHKDRQACELSMTLNIRKTHDWPIWLTDRKGNDVSIDLPVGSGLLYHGIELEHWRHPYTGSDHINVFLHWVRAFGAYSNYVFDRG
ncbi:hypothetical protein N8Z63_03705 [Octadecabacter sp.]|nr:hypothetical protein [Octadecabacter sp.]